MNEAEHSCPKQTHDKKYCKNLIKRKFINGIPPYSKKQKKQIFGIIKKYKDKII